MNADASPRVNIEEVRIHHAAALIAWYVRKGGELRYRHFICPIIPESSIFDHYWSDPVNLLPAPAYRDLLVACLLKWPREELLNFSSFAILRLMQRHGIIQQYRILKLLKEIHGFPI